MTVSSSSMAALFLPPNYCALANYETVAKFIALSTTAMCEFFDLRDFNERSSPKSLEGMWIRSLLETALDHEIDTDALKFVDQLVLDARANQTISTEFLNENSYLYNRYDFDDAVSIENESMEAFKLYFKGANLLNPSQSYVIKIQYPTKWLVAIRNLSSIEQKTEVLKQFLEQYSAGSFWDSEEGLGFCLQVETMSSRVDLPLLKDVVSKQNVESKNLSYLMPILELMAQDIEKIKTVMQTPSFACYEANRNIVPEIIQTTGCSLLVRPFTPHAKALENIMAQRKVMDILKKSKYKG